jgi:hypothetical protein
MVDESGGHADQAVPQGGDHRLTVADAMAEQCAVRSRVGGELM